ncbi:hypothetical protein NPIL_575551 [Nephila pilipes]|uniref:Uncharacterized protein n=1 Tax=Nephila pilipes TaxID=299642 RepID=A0A8X6NRP2_NEPPI|nr:hypothetical protein NPIL_575551 [Nephila pilipes]
MFLTRHPSKTFHCVVFSFTSPSREEPSAGAVFYPVLPQSSAATSISPSIPGYLGRNGVAQVTALISPASSAAVRYCVTRFSLPLKLLHPGFGSRVLPSLLG